MKFKASKQTYMKGLLLATLAVNISWQPALDAMKSLELASTTPKETVGSGTTTPGGTRAEPLPNSGGVGPQAAKPETKPESKTEPKPVAAPKDPKGEGDEDDKLAGGPEEDEAPDTLEVCGVTLKVAFKDRKVAKRGQKVDYTYAVITEEPSASRRVPMNPVEVRIAGKSEVVLDDPKKLGPLMELAEKETEKNLSACHAAKPKEEKNDRELRADREREKREKARIARQEKECRADSSGTRLTEAESLDCKLERLVVAVDQEDSQEKANRLAERLINGDVKRFLKDRLSSSDEDKNEEGRELLSKVRDTVKDMKLSDSSERKLTKGLDGVEAGAETKKLIRDKKEDVDKFGEEFKEAYNRMKMNPNDPSATFYMQEMMNRYWQMRNDLQSSIQGSQSYKTLQMLRNQGFVNPTDFNDFTMDYNQISMNMMNMLTSGSTINANMGSLLNPAPNNLGNFRTQYWNSNLNQLSIPRTPPQLGNLGLNTNVFNRGGVTSGFNNSLNNGFNNSQNCALGNCFGNGLNSANSFTPMNRGVSAPFNQNVNNGLRPFNF